MLIPLKLTLSLFEILGSLVQILWNSLTHWISTTLSKNFVVRHLKLRFQWFILGLCLPILTAVVAGIVICVYIFGMNIMAVLLVLLITVLWTGSFMKLLILIHFCGKTLLIIILAVLVVLLKFRAHDKLLGCFLSDKTFFVMIWTILSYCVIIGRNCDELGTILV